MIIKINYTHHLNGEITLNKVIEMKPENIKLRFSSIKWYPFIQVYKCRIDKGKLLTGNKYVYLFNTELDKPHYSAAGGGDSIYDLLDDLSKPYVREFKINDILK